jgi:cation transport ATPase
MPGALQARAKAKTGDAVAALLNLTPKTALLVEAPAEGLTGALETNSDAGSNSSNSNSSDTKARVAAAGGLLAAAKVREVPLELVQVGNSQ